MPSDLSTLPQIFEHRDLDAPERDFGGLRGIAESLHVDVGKGIGDEQAEDLRSKYGENRIPTRQAKPLWRYFVEASSDKILILLSLAALVSVGTGIYQDFFSGKDPSEPKVGWVEGVAILSAVVLVISVNAINDYRKDLQFRKLNESVEERNVRVKRNGQHTEVSIYDVVVGDILLLAPGDIVPVDALLVSTSGADGLKIDESSATGESGSVRKSPLDAHRKDGDNPDPYIISGSKVQDGDGKALVVCVGKNSVHGRTMLAMREGDDESTRTPLEEKLERLAERIAKFGLAAAGLLVCALLVKYLITASLKDRPVRVGDLLSILIQGITVLVVAVPEGLPMAVTIALSFATTKMLNDNNLVRVLSACETMANATSICTDKTGTLTWNKMTVVRGLVSGMQFRSSAQSDGARKEPQSPHGKESKDGVSKPTDGDMDGEVSKGQEKGLGALLEALKPEVRSLICEGIAINSTAFEKPSKNNPDTPSERSDSAVDNGPDERSRLLDSQPRKNQHTDQHMQERVFVGSQTEAALLRFTTQIPGCDYRDVRNRLGDNILVRLPFSSARKTMTTVVPVDRTDSAAQGDQGAPGAASKSGKCRVYVKGAAEMVLSECTRILGKDGSAVDLSDTERMNLERTITRFAKDALRAVCLAYKEMGVSELPDEDNKSAEDDEQSQDRRVETLHKDLVLLAILGIEDPLRPGVLESVRRCRNAGVFVRMVTGDNSNTAEAIARKSGIKTRGGIVMEGRAFRDLPDSALRDILPRLQVLARSNPLDKQKLVKALKDVGEVVAVTGDGTNDGPALKAADVGFSMGQSGTEVAKEASSIVLLDDSFPSLVLSLLWGRAVNASVRKFLQFQMTVNFAAVITAFFSSLVNERGEGVLGAVQMLWVNLIMDSFAALALSTDPPNEKLLLQKPQRRASPLITFPMWKQIILSGVFQVGITLGLLGIGGRILDSLGVDGSDEGLLRTFIFTVFVMLQVFNEVNCRSVDEDEGGVFAGLWKNPYFIGIIVLTIVGQVLIVTFGGRAFETTPLPPSLWAIATAIGSLSLVVGWVIRWTPDWFTPTSLTSRDMTFTHEPSTSRMGWEGATSDVRRQLKVYRALRRSSR